MIQIGLFLPDVVRTTIQEGRVIKPATLYILYRELTIRKAQIILMMMMVIVMTLLMLMMLMRDAEWLQKNRRRTSNRNE